MHILIDVDRLEKDGVLTAKLAETLRTHAKKDTGGTAINALLAFGAIAVAGGMMALIPHAGFCALLALGFVGLGWLISRRHAAQWGKLGSIWMVVGGLILSVSVGMLINHPFAAPLVSAVILAGVAVPAESRLLIALTPLAIMAAIGGSTGYWHATYMICVEEPTLSILLFSALAYGAWQLARRSEGVRQLLSLTFARMCVILVNMGFWIGSLWGDTPGRVFRDAESALNDYGRNVPQVDEVVFIIGWAVALLLAGAWGARRGRRFMVNTVAVFFAIHFYTQWFEHIGLYPFSVIVAGVATIAFALGVWRYNRKALA